MEKIKDRLYFLRKTFDISIPKIIKHLDIKHQTYYNYESGRVVPSVSKLIMLSEFYNVSLDYLVGRTNNTTYKSSDHYEMTQILVESGYTAEQLKLIVEFLVKFRNI